MKKYLFLIGLITITASCNQKDYPVIRSRVDWNARSAELPSGFLISGSTYLSLYSEVYHLKEGRTHDLTATVSMRNPNPTDTLYIHNARYFNTAGNQIRTYFEKAIYVAPMETVQIVIEENDKEGGAGASFQFTWSTKPSSNEPIFEAVMISTSGQQGLSFTTKGVRLK